MDTRDWSTSTPLSHPIYSDPDYRLRRDPPHSATWSAERRAAAWSRYDAEQVVAAQAAPHPIFGTPTIPTTGVEDVDGWAFKRARTCEATLSPEEVFDAEREGVDVRAVKFKGLLGRGSIGRFNGRWFVSVTRTAIASGLDPATNPGEFIALDDAECMALERVREHWRVQAEHQL